MPSVVLTDVSLSFGARRIFDSVGFSLGRGDKVALAGANGSGKTTLMRLITTELKPDTGRVDCERDTRIAYMPQSGVVLGDLSVYKEAERAYHRFHTFTLELEQIEDRLASLKEDTPEGTKLLDRNHELHELLVGGRYYDRRSAIEAVLSGLGFSEVELDRPARTFSSGWQMRIALAGILLAHADILLLDEPTNYLDLEARDWLEGFLKSYSGGVLVVSHDRFFLDVTVDAVVEIYMAQLSRFKGNYTAYETIRWQQLQQILQQHRKQEEEIDKLEAFVRRFRYNASKARLVQSRIKRLEKIERVSIPPALQKMHFRFPDPPHSGKVAFSLRGVRKSYGGKIALADVDLEVGRGEKLALLGPNGAGKTTLMRLIAGRLEPDSGTLRYGIGVATGYFSADGVETEFTSGSLLENIEQCAPTEMIPRLRGLLGAFLFRDDDIYKSAAVLSGGEKSRLALVKLLLLPANLLLLDEPTSHLDMVSKDILLEALQRYSGTLVFVSHDRYFIERLATRILKLDEGRARLYLGDYDYFRWKTEQEEKPGAYGGTAPTPAREAGSQKMDRSKEKQLRARLRKLEKEEEAVLAELETLEAERERLLSVMNDEAVYRDGEKMRLTKAELTRIRGQIGQLSARWERIGQTMTGVKEGLPVHWVQD